MTRITPPSRFSSGQAILLLFTTLPGIAGVVIFVFFAFQSWSLLDRDFTYFNALVEQTATLEAIFVAEAQQNIHRLNLMTDSILALLSAILAAIGIHGSTRNRY